MNGEDGYDFDEEWLALARYPAGIIVYHATSEDAVPSILDAGFRDTTSTYMMGIELTGVWVSNRPLDQNQGTKGRELLRIYFDVDETAIDEFEIKEEEKTYREWCVPAVLLNERSRVERVESE